MRKHNYDSPDFYKRIEALAMNGYTDSEIANELNLSDDVFGSMKNGNYQCWNDEENKRRGDEIGRVLARAGTLGLFVYFSLILGGRYFIGKSPILTINVKMRWAPHKRIVKLLAASKC